MAKIEKLEPGEDVSARVVEKMNELIDMLNELFEEDGWEVIWGGRDFTKKGGVQ